MMAEENDDGNQDEGASLENDGTESGEKSRVLLIQKIVKCAVKSMGKVKVVMVVMVEKTTTYSVSGWKM
jgi:hypothetical protein